MTYEFEFDRARNGWIWIKKDANGEVVAISPLKWESEEKARGAVESLKLGLPGCL